MPIFNFHLLKQETDGRAGFSPVPMANQGPLLTVLVGPPPSLTAWYQDQNRTPPAPEQFNTLIDTGATRTTGDIGILEKLGVKPVDWVEVLSPNQLMKNGVYPVSMTLVLGPSKLTIPTIPVIGSDLKGQPIKGLVGRDILANCVFIYNGVGGHYTLAIG